MGERSIHKQKFQNYKIISKCSGPLILTSLLQNLKQVGFKMLIL